MLTRRQFLQTGCTVAAASGVVSFLGDAKADSPAETAPYRALVCIALGGGADSFNMLVPTDQHAYRHYAERRGNIALDHGDLLLLHHGDCNGQTFGLHPAMRELRELYTAGDVAILANTGPLQGPVANPGRIGQPDLSHTGLIARWHQGATDQHSSSGWAGRIADALGDCGWQNRLPVNISVSGRNVMQLGEYSLAADLRTSRYQQRLDLPPGVDFTYVNEQLAEQTINTGRPGSVRRKMQLLSKVETECRLAVENTIAGAPGFQTDFALDSFSADLRQVARLIAARNELGARRQIFFVHFDGWDHHHDLLKNQAALLPVLSKGLAAFHQALTELDVLDEVTTFTISEFGRALATNGSGSDHGWGGHHIIMGGTVQGGKVYGRYPSLATNNPLDIGGGSFMPTTSMDEYLAELALWLGIPVSDLPYVLPDVAKFWSVNSQTSPLGILA